MFVRKIILLDKHNSNVQLSVQVKKKNNKIFITSPGINKYPVRYNDGLNRIGHFNHIVEAPSAYVYDLNEDISKGFVKHDYSELHDQDSLESVELNSVKDGIIVFDDKDSISKTTPLTLDKKYYCKDDYVVEIKNFISPKGLYIYKLIDNQLVQIAHEAISELAINKFCYIINNSADSKFLTILARNSIGELTVNELNKETDILQVYILRSDDLDLNGSRNVNAHDTYITVEYTPEVSLSLLAGVRVVSNTFTFNLSDKSTYYHKPIAYTHIDHTILPRDVSYYHSEVMEFKTENGLADVALMFNTHAEMYIRFMRIDLNADIRVIKAPNNTNYHVYNCDSSGFIKIPMRFQTDFPQIFTTTNIKDNNIMIELISDISIVSFQIDGDIFNNLTRMWAIQDDGTRNVWTFEEHPELMLDIDIISEQRMLQNNIGYQKLIMDSNSAICGYYNYNSPLIETNKSFKSIREQYSNPLLNRTLEDEIFDSKPVTNSSHPAIINLPKGQYGYLSEYNQIPYWNHFLHYGFLIHPFYNNVEISEFRVYGDSAVVDTLNGKYSNNEAQTMTMYYHYTNYSNGGTSGGTPRNKNTSSAFDLLKESYTDSKIFNINGKEIDLSSIVNMSKCTFTPKNVKELDSTDMIIAFDFWSVESSVVPPSTMYFELDLKFYKNLRYDCDYEAEYELVTLKAITLKPSGRFFGFSVSNNFKELFVEQYPGTFAYNIYPGFWSVSSHPTVSTITSNSGRPTGFLFTDGPITFTTNDYSYINKKAVKQRDHYITVVKATGQSKEYEIMYVNIIPIDDFTTEIKFKVKLNKGLKFKTKVAIIVDSNDLFIEFNDSKYSQLIFDINDKSLIEFKISSKQLPINNEIISNISYKIQDVDSSIQYINIKDI